MNPRRPQAHKSAPQNPDPRSTTSPNPRPDRPGKRSTCTNQSVLEDLVLDLILSAGFAHPDVNVPLRINGATIIPDFRWPEQRLIVEADGAAYHGNTKHEDAARQAQLEQH